MNETIQHVFYVRFDARLVQKLGQMVILEISDTISGIKYMPVC